MDLGANAPTVPTRVWLGLLRFRAFQCSLKSCAFTVAPACFPPVSPLRPRPWPAIAQTRLLRSPLWAPRPPRASLAPAPSPSPPPNRSRFGLRGSKTTVAAPPALRLLHCPGRRARLGPAALGPSRSRREQRTGPRGGGAGVAVRSPADRSLAALWAGRRSPASAAPGEYPVAHEPPSWATWSDPSLLGKRPPSPLAAQVRPGAGEPEEQVEQRRWEAAGCFFCPEALTFGGAAAEGRAGRRQGVRAQGPGGDCENRCFCEYVWDSRRTWKQTEALTPAPFQVPGCCQAAGPGAAAGSARVGERSYVPRGVSAAPGGLRAAPLPFVMLGDQQRSAGTHVRSPAPLPQKR